MDNLTHSLVGAALADSVFQRSPSVRRPTVAPQLRLAFWVVSVIGGNLPDWDVLYAGLTLGGRLGSLLHHRGHTHTFLLALVQGALLAGVAQMVLRRRVKKLGAWDRNAIWGLALLGPVVHICLDGLNNYGIHPFWPFWNGWIYGDTLFIIEPLLWVALFPVIYFATQRRAVRWVAETMLVALFTAMWILPITRWYSALAIGCLGFALWLVVRKSRAKFRADFCLGTAVVLIAVFCVASSYCRRLIAAQNTELYPSAKLHDVILTPYPANPFCWNVITVETFSENSRYRMRRGRFSPWSTAIPAENCPRFPSQGSTAFLSPVPDLWGPAYAWEGQYQTTVGDLKDYKEYSCGWLGFLKFARAPFLQEEGESLWAGDLRYDYGPELGFAEMEVPEQSPPCPRTPDWIPPRGDLF